METATLTGRVALVAGATRGAGRALAVELARAGAFVYATGRSSRTGGASEIGRPETIEDTLDRMIEGGGSGASVRVDHTQPDEVRALVERIRSDHGRLDVLVNDIFGGDRYADFGAPVWEHDLEGGLRMLRMGIDTHVITSALALPLMLESGGGLLVEMTDGPREVNREYRQGVGFYYDYVKGCIDRLVTSLTAELADEPVTVVGVTPGWLRSEAMLENFGVTEETWTEAAERVPGFGASETPKLRRTRGGSARRRCGRRPSPRLGAHRPAAVRHLWRHRRRRLPSGLLGCHPRPRVGGPAARGRARVPVAVATR